ncbi:hypothetical protein V7079_22715 [Priestia megaterium]|uniref:structural cement protein Gp24 n=1 Tax=Priestia megaterium TaxID=1404 RepID=UPI003000745F
MAITSYDKYMPAAGGKGKLANYQDYSADTKAAAEDIPYGVAVQLGTDGETITRVKAGGKPYGVSLAQEINDWVLKADDQKYLRYDPVAAVRKGVIWVQVDEDVVIGDGVVVDPTTSNFRPADTATSGVIAFPSAAFKSSAQAGGLVQLEINLP